MKSIRELKILRAETAERQRRAGVNLADNIRMLRSPASRDLFEAAGLAEVQDSLLDRIEDLTQQLLELDEQIERMEERTEGQTEVWINPDDNRFSNTSDY